MGCSPEKVENPVASRSPDRHRWQAPPDPRLKPRKNTHFHLLKDACYTLRMEQPRPLDGSKVQTLVIYDKADLVQATPLDIMACSECGAIQPAEVLSRILFRCTSCGHIQSRNLYAESPSKKAGLQLSL